MRCKWIILNLILAVSSQLVAQELGKKVNIDFALNPGVQTKEVAKDKKISHITGTFKLPANNGKSFESEFQLKLEKFTFWGAVTLGFSNSTKSASKFAILIKRVRKVKACGVYPAPETTKQVVKPFTQLKTGNYWFRFSWSAPNRIIRWRICDSEHNEIYDSGEVEPNARIDFDQFFISVSNARKIGAGEVSYNNNMGNLFFKSHVGIEKKVFPYLIEGNIDDLTIKYMDE
jgi:hypothetical protein